MNMDVMAANYQSIWDRAKEDLKRIEDRGVSKADNGAGGVSGTNESKLSSKAQDFLKNLRSRYKDYDFFVGNGTDDLKSLAKSGTKEFSVIFSGAELERMANDEKYAQEKLNCVKQAVKMSEEIDRRFGFQSALGKDGASDTVINKIGIVFNDDGTTSFFAELEKSSAKQRERIEKAREEKNSEIQSYSKSNRDAKRTSVQANSMEELLDKILAVDWSAVKSEKTSESGGKFDYSI